MVDTPSPKPDTGSAPVPFKRGQIVWSRPPQTVFQVGQAARGGVAPAAPVPPVQTPRTRSSSGILNGSMIPRAAPASARNALPAAPTPTAPTLIEPTPSAPPQAAAAEVASMVPLPKAAPAPVAEPDPSILDIDAVRTTDAAPEPVVPSYAAVRPKAGVPAVAWIGGAIALVVVAGVAWWALRPAADAPAALTTPAVAPAAAPALPVPVEAAPVSETEAAVQAPDAIPDPEPSASAAEAPARTTSPAPAPARAAPTSVAPSPTPRTTSPPTTPRIETAPLVVAPVASPTAAEAPASDPDAPIRTRPQPLN